MLSTNNRNHTRDSFAVALVMAFSSSCPAADLPNLPPNTWVELKYTTIQPADPRDKGQLARAGWNKLVYDPDGKRVLFYDRWYDKRHGGTTIYGNCLFAFDAKAGTLTPVKIDNWTKIDTPTGGYRTVTLPENDDEPTPCPRHVYHGFEYVPELKSVFLCNGANQSAMKDGKVLGHDLCDGAWRLDVMTKKWTKLDAAGTPPNRLDDAMAYCPDTKSIIYAGTGRQLWILDLAAGGAEKGSDPQRKPRSPKQTNDAEKEAPGGQTPFRPTTEKGSDPQRNPRSSKQSDEETMESTGGQTPFRWRKAKASPPARTAMGQTIFYDPTQRRMMIAGGGQLDAWAKGPAREFRELYAFDPKTETVTRLADCPTAFYATHLAYDSKRQLFFAVVVYNKGEQPSGMFAYDPHKNAWQTIKPANPIPPHQSWFGWMKLCYDAGNDCLIGMIGDKFYAYRPAAENDEFRSTNDERMTKTE